MNLILQNHSKGCGVAVLAMLLNEDYDDTRSRLFGEIGKVGGYFASDILKLAGCLGKTK